MPVLFHTRKTGLSLWRPPEPGTHCRPVSDVNRRLEFSAANWRLTCSMSLFRNNLTKLITVIMIWRFRHFCRILYCFYIFLQWSCSNCTQNMREKSGCRRGKSSLSRRENSAAGSNASLLMTSWQSDNCGVAVMRYWDKLPTDSVMLLQSDNGWTVLFASSW